jgi:hypothetical protein
MHGSTNVKKFENLARHFRPAVNKRNTNFRNASSVKKRLAIALRFPATGDTLQSITYLSKVSPHSVSILTQQRDALTNADTNLQFVTFATKRKPFFIFNDRRRGAGELQNTRPFAKVKLRNGKNK